MVRALDSGSGDPGSILGRSVCCFLEQETFTPQKVLVIPRNRWLRLNMTEKLFTGTLNHNQNKNKIIGKASLIRQSVSHNRIYRCTPEYINVGLVKKTTLFILDKNGV